MKSKRVLIIKTGFSEFLDRGISTTVSLGDVLTCTTILHLYKNDEVTWVTAWAARQLLKDNPYITELLIFGPQAFEKIAGKSYDILINLEKDIGICTFLRRVRAKKRYGFYFNERIHDIATHNNATRYLLSGQENHKNIDKTFLEILFETVGEKWQGQGYVLSRRKKSREKYDIGFNYSVGSKWPTKAWPLARWEELEKLLQNKYSLSWQQGHKNLFKYIEWIDRCRVIVTSDSLGQAIAAALGKKVIVLYGPTNFRRMQGIHNLTVIPSELACPMMPCYLPICKFDRFCMDYILPEKVALKCEELLSSSLVIRGSCLVRRVTDDERRATIRSAESFECEMS